MAFRRDSRISPIILVSLFTICSQRPASSMSAEAFHPEPLTQSVEQKQERSPEELEQERLAFYRDRVRRLDSFKEQVSECVNSLANPRLAWKLIKKHELPHRAFATLVQTEGIGDEFIAILSEYPSLVVRGVDGKLRLTRDALSAWARMHAELVAV